jgi:phosphoribosylaminoimidazole-succinocarboxamide synthase
MTKIEKLIFNDFNKHIKTHELQFHRNNKTMIFSCEIDRIQSIARSIAAKILKKYGSYKILSTNKNTKNLGFTRIVVTR